MSIQEFDQKVRDLGLNQPAFLFRGKALLTEATDTSFTFKSKDQEALKVIQSRVGFAEQSELNEGVLTYNFGEKLIVESQEPDLEPIVEKFFARKDMPQIDTAGLLADLKAAEKKYEELDIAAKDLQPSQKEFNLEKVKRIAEEGTWKKKPIISTNDGFVVDGHHRWKAALEKESEVKSIRVDMGLKELLKFVKEKDYVVYKNLKESVETLDGKSVLNKDVHEGNCIELCVEQDDGKIIAELTVTGAEGEVLHKQQYDTIAMALKVAKTYDVEISKETVMKLYQTFV